MTTLTILLLLIGIGGYVAGWTLYTSNSRRLWRIMSYGLWCLASLLFFSGSYSYWYHHRPQPAPVSQETLFQGVIYTRKNVLSPRPNVVHIVTIDLKTPGIRFLVTPGMPIEHHQLPARTTSQFLQEFGVQVAINGNFYYPFSGNILSQYPHVGDPVSVYGFAMSQGQQYSLPQSGYNTLYISRHNQVAIGTPLEQIYNALSGYRIFVKDNTVQYNPNDPYYANKPGPRTAVALDQTAQKMILLVVDGRQPNYSEGMTLAELGDIAVKYGAYIALNLDNGGSSTLVIEGPTGKPVVLNSPIHRRIPPGRERPVANHLGIFANRIGQEQKTGM